MLFKPMFKGQLYIQRLHKMCMYNIKNNKNKELCTHCPAVENSAFIPSAAKTAHVGILVISPWLLPQGSHCSELCADYCLTFHQNFISHMAKWIHYWVLSIFEIYVSAVNCVLMSLFLHIIFWNLSLLMLEDKILHFHGYIVFHCMYVYMCIFFILLSMDN